MDTVVLVERMRRIGAELGDVEVKAAVGGLPASVPETVSAFANGSGGTLLLGLDETNGFRPAPRFDPKAIRDALAGACADKLEPPVRAPIEVEEFEGSSIVRLDVAGLDPVEKPSFVKARGAYGGSFIRGGDGDRRLSHYEVTQLLANRSQPTHDHDPVIEATVEDLDPASVDAYLARVRTTTPRFRETEDDVLLRRLGVLRRDEAGVQRPTIAGLLCLGQYPQEFFPQLFVSFVALPGLTIGDTAPDGTRFLDNRTITGPIPTMVADGIAAAIQNMRKAAVIRGIGREDRYDYPLAVVRELLVNALMHRDYSPEARGAQVQVELYPDRLVVKSPGGLYGPITPEQLGTDDQVSTSRNQRLASLLADVTLPGSRGESLCENRGSGLPSVMAELRRVGMSPPEFDIGPGQVVIKVPQTALLSPETIHWIGMLGLSGLTDEQHLALAMMRNAGRVTNSMLQAWGVNPTAAGRALRDLVVRRIAISTGGRRYASYRLVEDLPTLFDPTPAANETVNSPAATGVEADLDAVAQAIRAGNVTAKTLRERLGINQRTLARRLAELTARGVISPTRPTRSSQQSYRIVDDRSDNTAGESR